MFMLNKISESESESIRKKKIATTISNFLKIDYFNLCIKAASS